MTLIVQLSDPHCVAEGTLAHAHADTNGLFAAAVARVNGLRPRPALVLITGDITDDDGTPAAYAAARRRLDGLEPPYRLLVGNHDDRAGLRAAFADHTYLPREGFLHYVLEEGPLRIVVLDTVRRDQRGPAGELCALRLAWLERALAAEPARPTLIAMHHPPQAVGLAHLDPSRLAEGEALARIVAAHGQIQALLCGHLHRCVTMAFAGSHVVSAPATGFQFPLIMDRRVHGGLVLEPPGFLLHLWRDGGLVSHHTHVADHWPAHPL